MGQTSTHEKPPCIEVFEDQKEDPSRASNPNLAVTEHHPSSAAMNNASESILVRRGEEYAFPPLALSLRVWMEVKK
nr:hypothetical protein Iba_scaffold60071CG0010 [Ipomoea batatas]GMD66170.1 hypothetical protein Iba_scaffold49619CG0010 [Ipomoea batatas]GMD91088.1 hypothetical protein Iba_scaffold53936CG0010 [Ipomoea batatas]GME00694.1 hypothetical protein Iba_scaffold55700CG0010 [Ipomoea batatas]GME00696.1 hypothetical protein Iba_scaffold55701CG0010 [Ipomoea batatas]